MADTEKEITPEIILEHGFTQEEYDRVLNIMGRKPNMIELGIFSVMWSEHCSYKSSKRWLRELPTEAPWVIQGPGENAGVIDIGDGKAAIFKMESHNHPSFIVALTVSKSLSERIGLEIETGLSSSLYQEAISFTNKLISIH